MQITIAQAEIEKAIRQYIGRMIQISDGANMEIELAATRGAGGFTATIDITSSDEPSKPAEARAPRPVPTLIQNRTPRTPAEVQKMMAEEAENEDKEEVQGSLDLVSNNETEVKIVTEDPNSEPVAAAMATRPLFRGLRKPSNP